MQPGVGNITEVVINMKKAKAPKGAFAFQLTELLHVAVIAFGRSAFVFHRLMAVQTFGMTGFFVSNGNLRRSPFMTSFATEFFTVSFVVEGHRAFAGVGVNIINCKGGGGSKGNQHNSNEKLFHPCFLLGKVYTVDTNLRQNQKLCQEKLM